MFDSPFQSLARNEPSNPCWVPIIDEASGEYLALVVARQLRHEDVLTALAELFIVRDPPAHILSDNGPEFIATAVQKWLGQISDRRLREADRE